MSKLNYSLQEISQHLGAQLIGDPDCQIFGIAPLDKAQSGQISFLVSAKYKSYLATTNASAVIVASQDAQECRTNALVMPNPYLGYAKTSALFVRKPQTKIGVHPSTVIGANCQIASNASIGAHCVIGDNVCIGEQTVIGPGSTIGADCSIGANCWFNAGVNLYHQVRIGDRVIIQSGAVLGSDGFGMVNDNGFWHKIEQLGGVVVGNDVEIGANTTIDRGALDDTVIEDGVKIDNQVQVAHNVHIGAHTVIAGCVGIAGSTRIGRHCMIGGAACINGHITISDGVIITATSCVSNSLTVPGIYSSGVPLQLNREWRKNAVRFQYLDEMARRLRKIEVSTT